MALVTIESEQLGYAEVSFDNDAALYDYVCSWVLDNQTELRAYVTIGDADLNGMPAGSVYHVVAKVSEANPDEADLTISLVDED